MATHEFTTDPSGGIVISSGYTLDQLAAGIHHEKTVTNISGAVSTLDFGGKAVILHTVTGNLSGSYTFPPINIPELTQNSTRTVLFIEYTQDATGGRAIPLNTLFANATRIIGMSGADCVDTAAGGKTRVRIIVKRIGGVAEYEVEFYPVHKHSNITVATQHSLTGGNTLGNNITLSLSGDTASPGNRKFYGTDAVGARGWKGLNIDDIDDVTITTPASNQLLTYNGSIWVNAEPPAGSGGSAVDFVDTISALQAIASPVDKQFIYVRGYTTAGDGGGGWFMWSAAATDYKMCTGATVAAGGTGYAVNDLIRPAGGTRPTTEDETIFRVLTLSGSAVATVGVVYPGYYSVAPSASGVATTTAASGTGCTLNLTIASYSNYGILLPKGSGGVGRWQRKYEGLLNVKWFGAVGDGVADDTLAIQRAVWTVSPLYFPPGDYKITSAIWWWTIRTLNIQGTGFSSWATSRIIDARPAGTQEAMFHKFGRWMKQDGTYQFETGYAVSGTNLGSVGGSVTIRNLTFKSTASIYGSGLELTLTDDVLIDTCQFECAFRGLTLGQATFDVTVISCRFVSFFMNNFPWSGTTNAEANRTIAKRAWAIYTGGHAFIYGVAIVGYGTALRFNGMGSSLRGARLEVNNYGLLLPTQAYNIGQIDTSITDRFVIDGVTFEANTIGILIDDCRAGTITNFGIQGAVADGSRPIGEIGIQVNKMDRNVEISNFWANGSFTSAAVINQSRYPLGEFTASGSGVTFASTNSFLGQTGGNIPSFKAIEAVTPEGTLTSFSNLFIVGLNGLNVRDGYARSRNFGDVVSPATSATTVNVTFPVAITHSTIAFNAITTPADAASTLAAGTYYYATTVVGKSGESGINYSVQNQHAYRTVVLGSTGLAVSFTFFGGSTAWVKRRIYRGTSAGTFDGYWEINMGSNFTDNGTTAFTRKGWPPVNGDLSACAEPDTNYQIALSPSWGTTAWVTSKTTTGFTINFGTAAPASQTCGWLLYRP